MKSLKNLLLLSFIALFSISASANPNAIEIVVPWGPGGGADIFARSLQKNSPQVGGPEFTITNRPGAGGQIATENVLKNSADGQRLLVAASGPFVFDKAFSESLPYDYKDFDIIGPFASSPLGFSSTPKFKTLAEFREHFKKNQATCGAGSAAGGFFAEYIFKELGMRAPLIVIYKNGAPGSAIDLAGGHIDCAVDTIQPYLPMYKSKHINVLAVTSENPLPSIPEVPVISNYVPGLVWHNWFAIATSKNTNAETRRKTWKAINDITKTKGFQSDIAAVDMITHTGEKNTQQWIDQQYKKIAEIRKSLNTVKP